VRVFTRALDDALGEKTRTLASEAIRRVLERSQEDAVVRFVKMVQTANLTSLVDVLDENVVRLIRELLAEEQVATVETEVLRRLAQAFPALEEADLPKVVQRFEQLLRQAFAEAHKKNSDKKAVRLTLR
jgi:tetrahydromethanopterin S-methyltransferase subunit A